MTDGAIAPRPPRLTVVVVVGPLRARAERCLDALLAQTAIGEMEIVVVDIAPVGTPLRGADGPSVLHVRRPEIDSFSGSKLEGFRHARSEFVAFIEDHVYACPTWAAAVLDAFRRPVAVVNFAFACANPKTYVSRASLLTEYGPWATPATPGPITHAACHNVAYRRSVLEPVLAKFAEPFESEFLIHRVIRKNGGVIWLEPRAVVAHENWLTLRDALRANSAMKRRIGHLRSENGRWGIARRVLYAGGMVLSPALHYWRTLRTLPRRPQLIPVFVASLPVSLPIYAAMSVSEAFGYLFGPGSSSEEFFATELDVARDE